MAVAVLPAGWIAPQSLVRLAACLPVRPFPAAQPPGRMVVERMVIFVYIYVPLGLLALLVVLARNIIGF